MKLEKTAIALLMLLLAAAFAAPAVAADAAKTWSLTVETEQGAALITGGNTAIESIRARIFTEGAPKWTLDDIEELVNKDFPGTAVQVFHEYDAAGTETEHAELPVRKAILDGLLPPIEALEPADALKVLSATGFLATNRDKWNSMRQSARLAFVASASGDVVIIRGTAQQDIVTIIFAGSKTKTGKVK
jgi:hypothetical protein